MNTVSPERNYAIDWLRVFAMFTVFLFHCARFFDRDDWHVENPQSDTILTFMLQILVQWIMPLFFILSGISSYYSLGFRKAGAHLRGRFKRLMIPLIFGIFVLIPLQVYFERISHSQFKGSFIAFYLIGLYIPVGIKYFAIASTSMVTILVLYEVFIRRVNLMRFLFGLKSKIQSLNSE